MTCRILALLIAFAIAAQPSCSRFPGAPSDGGARPASARAVPAAGRLHEAGIAARQKGNVERALEYFAAAWKLRPGHPGISRDFHEALVELKRAGDAAFREGRAEEAGRTWSAVLAWHSHPAARERVFPWSRAEVRAGQERLSTSLYERGLLEYRKGNLEGAIATWRTILAYDPTHRAAARSAETASAQLERLRRLGTDM